jgi:hypothetical protein
MVGAAADQTRRWLARVASVLVLGIVGCGGDGKDRSFVLPPGTAVDGTASARLLLVVEASNECESHGNCIFSSPAPDATPSPTPAAPSVCDVGLGNTRGLALYRLGTGGLFLDSPAPGTPDDPEQVIATGDNPRRVLVHPNKPHIAYVATLERIQVFRLASAAAGGTRCIGQTRSEVEIDPEADDLDPIDLAIDATVGDGVLYVASAGRSRIDAYAIAPDGTLPDVPTSCAIGANFDEFSAVAPLTADFIAAAGRERILVYQRSGGQFPPPSAAPEATPTPLPSPEQRCQGVQNVTLPVSVLGGALVTDLLFAPSASAPIGQLFISEEVSRRVFTFPIDAAGMLAEDNSSRTSRAGVYQYMLRHDIAGAALLYSSVFNEGRVDVFRLEPDGLLPSSTFSRTAEDPDALPVGLAIDGPTGTLIYVAEGGLGRVDGFRILPDGGVDALPLTSTRVVLGNQGQILDTFPNDLAIVTLP